MNIKILVLLSLFSCASLFAQEKCVNYHKTACTSGSEGQMVFDSQSKSTTLGMGQISEFHMVGYEGLDYKVTICHEAILGDQIRFKVYQKKKKLVKPEEAMENETNYEEEIIMNGKHDYYEPYGEEGSTKKIESKFRLVKELLYDNEEDNYTNELEFTAAGSLSLIIEISVGAKKNKQEITEELSCVGVLIEHMETP